MRCWLVEKVEEEERLAVAVRVCFSVLMTHLAAHGEKALRQRWGVTVCVSLLLVVLVQCIHVKRTFSVNSSFFGAKAINHSGTVAVVLGALIQVCLHWEQPLSPTNQLWFFFFSVQYKVDKKSEDTRKKGSPVCPIYVLKKKQWGVLLAHTCAWAWGRRCAWSCRVQ